jgi:O-antigen/teichoic acid export membrane protein
MVLLLMGIASHLRSLSVPTQRLLRGLSATAVGPVVTAAIQLGAVPLLLHAWGAAKYGDWLLLSAIPSYLTLSDLGFGDASGSDMTLRVAAGDRDGALETFQSSLVLLVMISVAVLLCVSSCVWFIPWQQWMHLSSLSSRQAAAAILVFATYITVGQQWGILESGFRCDGNFAIGNLCGSILRFSEALFGLAVGISTGSLFQAASTYLVVRIFGIFGYALLLRRKSPWLTLGFKWARLHRVRELAGPALGFMALPLGYAISLQGSNLMIGFLKGPLAVAAFSTLRTMTRLNFQLMTVVAWAVWPELSAAFGEGNIPLARMLHRRTYQAGVVLSLLIGTLLWHFGPYIYRSWIRNDIRFDATCFHILLGVTFANSLWFISSVVPMSTNVHQRLAVMFVVASLASLILARILTPSFGIAGTAWALLLTDTWMIWVVLRTSMRQLQDTFSGFVTAMLELPTVWPLLKSRGEVRT